MKKRALFLTITCITLITSALELAAQDKKPLSPSDSAVATIAGADVKAYYGRPSKRGREVFGNLVPYGEVWRTGANTATEIVFGKNMIFGGKAVKAGRYALFTIPGKDKWTIILSNKLGQWGAFSYNTKDDVVRVEAAPISTKDVTETLTIRFDKNDKTGAMVIMWDQTFVSVPIAVN